MSDKIRLALVDDHPIFREGLVAILRSEPDIEIVGIKGSAEGAVQLAREELPDIFLLDLNIPGGGLNAARSISQSFPIIKIVMLTGSDDQEDVMTALKSGAHAYVLKGVAARELIHVLHSVMAGESYVTPSLAAGLLSEMTGRTWGASIPGENGIEKLTERERQILELIARGMGNREIGVQLHLTEKTIKHYVTNILQKLQVHNRVQAALLSQKTLPRRP